MARENKGKRTSQKHPNSFPSSGKGRVAVFNGPAILADVQPSSKSRMDFVISRRHGARLNWLDLTAVVEVTSEEDGFPIESAFVSGVTRAWRAAVPGTQTVRLV
jgi:hypothetical protein